MQKQTKTGALHALEFEKPIIGMEREIERLEQKQASDGIDLSKEIASFRSNLHTTIQKTYGQLTPWQTVLVARHPQRPLARDYINSIFTDFCELHGDKLFADDKAMVCGFARLEGQRVMVVALHKGRDTKEKIAANFGCAHPDGYRKALQKMKLAAKFGVPVVCLIDTPGAYPGVEAEERGIASAIAVNLMELSRLATPMIACVIGEGGSGGALGIAIADRVAVMEHAYYSVISPEGCAAILWKSGEHAQLAANALRLTAPELQRLKLIDSIVQEPLGGAHRDPALASANVKSWMVQSLKEVCRVKMDTLLTRRYDRLRNLGSFFDGDESAPKRRRTTKKAGKEVVGSAS